VDLACSAGVGCCERGNEYFVSIKGEKFLDIFRGH
jgi:hypothetical protein